MSETYNVVFAGELREGFEQESVMQAFSDMFKISQEGVQKYFTGKPRVVKKNLDATTATKYQKVFAKVGANVEVLKIEKAAENISTPDQQKQSHEVTGRSEVLTRTVVETIKDSEVAAMPVEISKQALAEEMIQKMQAPASLGINKIEAGRRRQQERMSKVKVAEANSNKLLMVCSITCFAIAVTDLAMFFSGNDVFVGHWWPSVVASSFGGIMLKSSRV